MNLDTKNNTDDQEVIESHALQEIILQFANEHNIHYRVVLNACTAIMFKIFVWRKHPFDKLKLYFEEIVKRFEKDWPIG